MFYYNILFETVTMYVHMYMQCYESSIYFKINDCHKILFGKRRKSILTLGTNLIRINKLNYIKTNNVFINFSLGITMYILYVYVMILFRYMSYFSK